VDNIIEVSLSQAHHKFGDLLDVILRGGKVRIINASRNKIVGYLVPPEFVDETLSDPAEPAEPSDG